jgi:gliding motility-associated-like protein
MKRLISVIPKILIISIILLTSNDLFATHNRAGEITFQQIGDLKFRVTITTYTKSSSAQADRDSLELFWGDGKSEWLKRSNGPANQGVELGNDIKKNIYIGEHTYPGMGTFKLSMTDPNRNSSILNVNPPFSDQVPFHLETTLRILDAFFSGYNTSPILSNPPIDEGCKDQVFKHNAGAFDLEGDSIAYRLIIPLQGAGDPVINYFFPQNTPNTTGSNTCTIDPFTGTLTWDKPVLAGEYNVAFIIEEYRNGLLISSTIRDMQITIENCNNRPPVIDPLDEICVVAGDTVQFTVRATDPDVGQVVTLSAVGGPIANSNGTFTQNTPSNPVTGVFQWITTCDDIQDQYYQLTFKAEDNFTLGGFPQFMVDYKTVRIRVVGPAPQDVQADVDNGEVDVTWASPYRCGTSSNFLGFSVWRKEGSNPFPIDTCTPGLVGKGYTLLDDEVKNLQNNRYFYKDVNVERGKFYCYRILGEFAEFTPSGQSFNLSESLPSEEICVQMSQDLPLMTNVSVLVTGSSNGQMEVRWSKPNPVDLDTIQNPGPYEYRLYRSDDLNGSNMQLLNTSTAAQFWQADDTLFINSGLSTSSTAYSYKVEFYSNGNLLGETSSASQIYLTIVSTDKKNLLSWEENIPWEHFEYEVYIKDNNTGTFSLLGTTTEMTFEHGNLWNGQNYCYYVKGTGSYNIPGIIDPIINFSQEACGVPIDTVAPCPPELTVTNRCNDDNFTGGDFENDLNWTNPNLTCANDVNQYKVYYAPTRGGTFSVVETLNGDNSTYLRHILNNSIAGCYYVTAIDSVSNESVPSNVVCVDNCPEYSLPNVFTPNGRGPNELFIPYPYRYISRVEMKIFNRQGNLVFQTEDPDINWNGKNLDGQDVAEGVYFYKCTVYEIRVDGETPSLDVLSGFIQLIRGK